LFCLNLSELNNKKRLFCEANEKNKEMKQELEGKKSFVEDLQV
jgi:hypothetical protein